MTREEWDPPAEDSADGAAGPIGPPDIAAASDLAPAASRLAPPAPDADTPDVVEPADTETAELADPADPAEMADAGEAADPADAGDAAADAGDAAEAPPPVGADDQPLVAGVPASIAGQVAAWWPTVFGFGLSLLVVIALARLGFVDDAENALQVIGVGPDRAVLLTSLLVGALGAALTAAAGGRLAIAAATGAGVILVGFYQVFRQETRGAMRAEGPDGTFDPVGWGLSALTLITVALALGWAAAVLGREMATRLALLRGAFGGIAEHRRRDVRAVARIAAAVAAVALVVITLPIFWDMLTVGPAVHMRQGGPPAWALDGPDPLASPAAAATSPTPAASQSAEPARLVPADQVAGPGSYVTDGALGSGRPWAAHPPTGAGRTVSVNLPAPWVGGLLDHATIDIYLPPGYDATSQHYPVIYEAHQPLSTWEQETHVTSVLDGLIGSGAIPPEIVVFVDQYGGPYADSECADSFDGREWFDRYLGFDVPAYVDANFRTIPTKAARSLLGFTSGGYCAAAVIARHPDVFGSALIFNGYFDPGARTATAPTAARPFNNDPALEAAASPIAVVPRLPVSVRAQLFFAFSTDAANRAARDQARAFTDVLKASGVPYAVLPAPAGHSWTAVREQLPAALALLAARQVRLEVPSGP